jgi:carboxylesterase
MAFRRVRSSDGVVADASPFRFEPAAPARPAAVLLVHGFTGTPFEMRLAGQALAARGLTTVGPRLAGHGGGWEELGATGWRDWLGTVEAAFDLLEAEVRPRGGRVAVVGLSLGGLLTLELARLRRERVAAIAVLSAPLWLPAWMARGIRFVARSRLAASFGGGWIPKLAGSDIADRAMRRLNPTGRAFSVRALDSLLDCMAHVEAHLGEVDRPALVAHGRRDHTAPFACAEVIASRIKGPVERLTLERSAHVITLDLEREQLFAALGGFLEHHL